MKVCNIIVFAGGTVALINNSGCLEWCKNNFGLLGLAACFAPSILGQGPCFDCGPHKKISTKELCSKKCVDLNTDKNNCGKCGTKCPTGVNCEAGVCRPQNNCVSVGSCVGNPPCPDASCFCQPDDRGGSNGYCNKPGLCNDFTNCQGPKDCPIPGSVCVTTCCPAPNAGKCFPPDKLCKNPTSRIFKPRGVQENREVEDAQVDELYAVFEEAMTSNPDKRDIEQEFRSGAFSRSIVWGSNSGLRLASFASLWVLPSQVLSPTRA